MHAYHRLPTAYRSTHHERYHNQVVGNYDLPVSVLRLDVSTVEVSVMRYTVTINEHMISTTEVEADSPEDAKWEAEENIHEAKIIHSEYFLETEELP